MEHPGVNSAQKAQSQECGTKYKNILELTYVIYVLYILYHGNWKCMVYLIVYGIW